MLWKTLDYSGWGRVRKAHGQMARPERIPALTTLVKAGRGPALGMLRSYGDCCLASGHEALDMTRLDRFLRFEDGVLEVEAGARLGEILRVFAPRGWLPAVLPGTGFATVGGAIANDVHGKNHHRAGSFAQHVESLSLLTPAGRKTIKPGTALFRATAGGLGQTGVIVAAKLRMIRCAAPVMDVHERRVENFEEFIEAFDSSRATYSVGWLDATARGERLGRGIFEEAEIGAGEARPAGKPRSVPFDAPSFLLSAPVVRLFNAAYLARVPAAGRRVTRPMAKFFFPLDRVHNWNRLYGKRGFHQFQCVVPPAEIAALRGILTEIAESGLASPLAVLKRMGPGRAGYLSFPMEGTTLACDFPNRTGATALIRRLADRAREAGGRIYLAKDALAGPKVVRPMYPELDDWARVVAGADPEGALTTDLVRRLKLRDMT